MHPTLIEFEGFRLRTFTVCAIAAAVCAALIFRSESRRKRWPIKHPLGLVYLCTLIGFIGSHLLYAVTRWSLPWDRWVTILLNFGHGNVWFGGFLASTAFCIFYARKQRIPILNFLDVAAFCAIVAQIVGRWGCFFGGCCYGRPTSLPWGISMRTVEYGVTWLHPVAVYESLYLLAVFALLWRRRQKLEAKAGQIAALYLILAPSGRLFIEFFRGDTVRGFVAGAISTSQFIALFLIFAGFLLRQFLKR